MQDVALKSKVKIIKKHKGAIQGYIGEIQKYCVDNMEDAGKCTQMLLYYFHIKVTRYLIQILRHSF